MQLKRRGKSDAVSRRKDSSLSDRGCFLKTFKEQFHSHEENTETFNFKSGSKVVSLINKVIPAQGIVEHAFNSFPRPVLVVDAEGCLIYANPVVEEMLDYSSFEMKGRELEEILNVSLVNDEEEQEAWLTAKNGDQIPVLVATSFKEIAGRKVAIIFCTDISRQKARERDLRSKIKVMKLTSENLKTLVKTDPLTGLLNRRGLEMVLNRETDLALRNGTEIICALIDLDDFKSINERFGHAGGDMILKAVGAGLKHHLRSSDWIGRVGGDEFMVFLPDTSFTEAISILERMRKAVGEMKIEKDGSLMKVTTSTGLAKLSHSVSNLQQVMEQTRDSLKQSKMSGKNLVSISKFEKNQNASISEVLMDSSLFSVLPQPIYNLSSKEIQAIELFSRGPTDELRAPDMFFQMARELKILTKLDMICFKKCVDYAEKFDNDYMIHINIFPETLEEISVDSILVMTEKFRKERTLVLEISGKTVHTHPEKLLRKVIKLKEAGILICLDDVGYGCSSVEALTMLEPHCVKLDRAIVCDLVRDVHQVSTTARILKVVRTLNCLTIAEGIETDDELKAVERIGVLYGQGWLWCDDLEAVGEGTIDNYFCKDKLDRIVNV